MPSRERWEALKPSYRARLESKGYTLENYLRGDLRKAARGHAATPERPERALRNPARYPEYVAKHIPVSRDAVSAHVVAVLLAALNSGLIKRFDLEKIERFVALAPVDALRVMATANYEDLASIASEQSKGKFVPDKYGNGLHRQGRKQDFTFPIWDSDFKEYANPFWYH